MIIAKQCPDCCICLPPVYATVPSVSAGCSSSTGSAVVTQTTTAELSYTNFDPTGGCNRTDVGSVTSEDDGFATITFSPDEGLEEACGPGPGVVPITYTNVVAMFTGNGAVYGEWSAESPATGTRSVSYSYGPGINGQDPLDLRSGSGSGTQTREFSVVIPDPLIGESCCAVSGEEGEDSTTVVVSIAVTGAPETAYSLLIRYSNTCEVDGETVASADTFDVVEVTTDEDGLAEVDVDVPTPSAGCRRCFESVESDQYIFRFTVPKTGKCYAIDWVERTVPEAGAALDTIEVVYPGVYRPAVYYSAPPAGGVRAQAFVTMSTAGGIAGVHLLNPGWGYDSPPTFTVDAANNGGTSSTGWTTTIDSNGRVTGTSGGSAGNYLPTIALSGDATATCAMSPSGGISAVTVTAGGSGYVYGPSLTLVPKVPIFTDATFFLHFGTETNRSWSWNGTVSPGYDPINSATWPTTPVFTLGNSNATLVNVRAVCTGCT